MSTETTEEWAARVAPTLDADGWQRAEQEAKRRSDGDPVNRWSIVEARALLAYRDREDERFLRDIAVQRQLTLNADGTISAIYRSPGKEPDHG